MKKNILLLCIILFGWTNLSADDGKAAQLSKLFQYLYQQQMFNGAVAVIDKGELLLRQGYGIGNFELNTPFTPDSQTEIASLSKQFTAFAILLLRDQGKLDIDDEINKFFSPALPYDGITVKHLLTHSSGVPDYEKYFKAHWRSQDIVNNSEIVNFLHKEKPDLRFPSGTKYEYSNLGYVLLAEIIQRVSGQRLDIFLTEHIFKPYGLTSTGFMDRATIFNNPNYAPGVVWDDKRCAYVRPETIEGNEYVWYLSGRFGPGRLTSTVNDLLKWDELLYSGKILSEASLKEMFAPHIKTRGKRKEHYGYGWVSVDSISHKGQELYHTGSWPGNLTYIKRYIEDRSTVVLINNTSSPYILAIRSAIDAILKGGPYELPKRDLDELLRKEICKANFNPRNWLKEHTDLTRYNLDIKKLEKLNKEVQEEGNPVKQQFIAELISKLSVE